MANITDPQGVRFCNDKVRALGDALLTVYSTAKEFRAQWDANSINTILTNTADVVVDGAAQDGRQTMTGAKANALYTAAGAIITWFETGSPSRIDQIRTLAVNGSPRF